MGILEEGEGEQEREQTYEIKTTENFPKLTTDPKSTVQGAVRMPSSMSNRNYTQAWHMQIVENQPKAEILEKKRDTRVRITSAFSSQTGRQEES